MKNLEKRGEKYFFRTVVNGRKIREFAGTNPAEARRRAKLLRDRYQIKRRVSKGSAILSVKEFAERWKSEYVAQQRNETGQKLAAARLERYIIPELGHLMLEDVRPEHVRGLRARVEASPAKDGETTCSLQTVKHVLSDARCLFRYAVEVGAIQASPFRGRLMPRIEEQAPRAFSEEQVKEILEASGRYGFPIRLALLTGLRWGEIHRLTWHHVRKLPSPHLELDRTKSGKVRRVPLCTEAQELLKKEKEQSTSVHVYAKRHGKPCQIVNFVRRRVEFPFLFHGLRHTFARRWVESGASLAVLQEILGHSSIAVTQRYARMTDEATFAEARRVLG